VRYRLNQAETALETDTLYAQTAILNHIDTKWNERSELLLNGFNTARNNIRTHIDTKLALSEGDINTNIESKFGTLETDIIASIGSAQDAVTTALSASEADITAAISTAETDILANSDTKQFRHQN